MDEYRWLEDSTNKEVQTWIAVQNAYARGILDNLPGVGKIRAYVTRTLSAERTSHFSLTYQGGKLFAIRQQPPKQQPFLVAMPGPSEPEKAQVLIDPNEMDPKGLTAIDWYRPSLDGKLVAVSLSKGGSETGDAHVYETATGREVYEVIPRVQVGDAGGDLTWAADSKGFFYTNPPRNNERSTDDEGSYMKVYYHELGSPVERDRYELGKELPRISEFRLKTDGASGRILATVEYGDSGQFAQFLRFSDGRWQRISTFNDQIIQAVFGPNGDIFLVSRQNAPRGKILHLSAQDVDLSKAKPIVFEGKDTIVTDFYGASPAVLPTSTRLYVIYQLGGPSEIRAFDFNGKPLAVPKQLPISSVGGLTSVVGDDVIFSNGSFVEPTEFYAYDAKTNQTVRTPLMSPPSVDFKDIRVLREFATSRDGTLVPVNILVPATAKLDGSDPCLVSGYGGFGVNVTPSFNPLNRLLFDNGVIVASANLRGGGEYGEAWHMAGNLTRKQNVFDDFAAVLQHMIQKRYTSPQRLAIIGGSNGGLLMGATLTQHPELLKAVISFVGIYDMLRVELSPNGKFNIPEYGSVKDSEQFKALYAYSPYHNVRDGTKYPATLFLTGANDPRVDPMQSRKMIACLQAATTSSAPILLRASATTGHGVDTALSERIEQWVDVYAFLFAQVGVRTK